MCFHVLAFEFPFKQTVLCESEYLNFNQENVEEEEWVNIYFNYFSIG